MRKHQLKQLIFADGHALQATASWQLQCSSCCQMCMAVVGSCKVGANNCTRQAIVGLCNSKHVKWMPAFKRSHVELVSWHTCN